jgi:hypothetical protein
MDQQRRPEADEGSGIPSPTLLVAVTRTGGFAGLTRQWKAEPGEDEASDWVALISRCPWDEPVVEADRRGADRFQWNIHATCGPDEDRTADLPDGALTGAWRELVDAVREWSDGRPETSH